MPSSRSRRPPAARPASSRPIRPRSRSIGGSAGAIVAAIVLGLHPLGPDSPGAEHRGRDAIAHTDRRAQPSPSCFRASGSAGPSVAATPALPGTIVFGTGWDNDTHQITGATTTSPRRAPASPTRSAWPSRSASTGSRRRSCASPRREPRRSFRPADGTGPGRPTRTTDGLQVPAQRVGAARGSWGKGTIVMRVYRGGELIGRGHLHLLLGALSSVRRPAPRSRPRHRHTGARGPAGSPGRRSRGADHAATPGSRSRSGRSSRPGRCRWDRPRSTGPPMSTPSSGSGRLTERT